MQVRVVAELIPQVRHDVRICRHLPDAQEGNSGAIRRAAKYGSANMIPQRLVELGGNLVFLRQDAAALPRRHPHSFAAEPLEALDVRGTTARSIEAVIFEQSSKEFRAAHRRPFPHNADAQDSVLIPIVVGESNPNCVLEHRSLLLVQHGRGCYQHLAVSFATFVAEYTGGYEVALRR
jgi:hypothetical protein